jgi:hypothetical protein
VARNMLEWRGCWRGAQTAAKICTKQYGMKKNALFNC